MLATASSRNMVSAACASAGLASGKAGARVRDPARSHVVPVRQVDAWAKEQGVEVNGRGRAPREPPRGVGSRLTESYRVRWTEDDKKYASAAAMDRRACRCTWKS
jgi:hypothetical protein